MDLGLTNSVAVVTGGSSGIGLATARLLLADGARVAICGRDTARLAAAVEQLGAPNADVLLAERCDVLDRAQVDAFARKVAQWGAARSTCSSTMQARVGSPLSLAPPTRNGGTSSS